MKSYIFKPRSDCFVIFINIISVSIYLQCYKRILQLDPVNIQGLHNLCVVYVERGKLAKAQECLQHAHQLAPTEDYILRHLQIVQTRIGKLKQTAGMSKEKEIAFAEFDPKDFGGNIVSDAVVDADTSMSASSSGSSDAVIPDTTTTETTTTATATTTTASTVVDDVDATMKNTIPSPIVLDVPDGKKETRKSVSKQEKPQRPPKQIDEMSAGATASSAASAVDAATVTSSVAGIDEPMFIETDATIQEEYRPSNSGQNGVSRRRYHQLHSHVPHHRAGQSIVAGNDRDDPSSGMS